MSSSRMEGLFGLSPLSHSPTQQQTLSPPVLLRYDSPTTAMGPPVYNPTPYQSSNVDGDNGGVDGDNSAGNGFGGEAGMDGSVTQPQMTVKRKRGRPRKYSPEGGSGGRSSPFPPPPSGESGGSRGRGKGRGKGRVRGRGRGASSGLRRDDRIGTSDTATTGSTGTGFTPYVITVKAGEDVLAKIMSFSQHGPRSICILTANGAISNVTLHQASISGGTVTYEGRFEILSLSGSFLFSESGDQRSRTGGLSVSLAGPDGHVLGGGVAGLLTAASSVQVIVGSFATESKLSHLTEPPSAPSRYTGGASAIDSLPSRGTLSGSSGIPVSPLIHSIDAFNDNAHGLTHMSWK